MTSEGLFCKAKVTAAASSIDEASVFMLVVSSICVMISTQANVSMTEDTLHLLGECAAGTDMAIRSLEDILKDSESGPLQDILRESKRHQRDCWIDGRESAAVRQHRGGRQHQRGRDHWHG